MPNLAFDQTCADATLVATAALKSHDLALTATLDNITFVAQAVGWRYVAFNQTCDPVGLVMTSIRGHAVKFEAATASAKMTAHVGLGTPPPPVYTYIPRIYNVTGQVRQTSGAILCFVGPPNKSVDWRILQGDGTLTPFSTFTDAQGRCSCRFDSAGAVGRVVIGAAYVP
jgi:hypothetical protein